MLNINVICVGKLKEKFYFEASSEYLKRLSSYCKIEVVELGEAKRPLSVSKSDIINALQKEALAIREKIPRGSYIIAMCVEGKELDSYGFASVLSKMPLSGKSRICFIIGGSDGLHDSIKELSDFKLSMSKMTFPHHLARIMLLEQIYRGFKINEGSKYHK